MSRTASILFFLISLAFLLNACSPATPTLPPVLFTQTPRPSPTPTVLPSATPLPTSTPIPTSTPNLAATQHQEALQADVQSYFNAGFLDTVDGRFHEYDDFTVEWAQINWYQMQSLPDLFSTFYIKGHFEWSSALDAADVSGCGFVFGLQEDGKHYAAILDRQKVLFLINSGNGSREIKPTRGSGVVQFGNPAQADFTLIVKDGYSYVLVDDQRVGEYSLSRSQPFQGRLGLTVLSGTNKDYGTRCAMTDLYAWSPD